MPLRDRAVVELEKDGRTGEFHLPGASVTNGLEREMLFGARGQLAQGLFDLLTGTGGGEGSTGVDVDAGMGKDLITVEANHGSERDDYSPALKWGDGSGDEQWDISPTSGHPQDLQAVLQWYARNSTTDSKQPAKLYWGPYSDGTYAATGGIFDPIDVVVLDCTTNWDVQERVSDYEVTITLRRTETFSDVEFDLGSLVPDF